MEIMMINRAGQSLLQKVTKKLTKTKKLFYGTPFMQNCKVSRNLL